MSLAQHRFIADHALFMGSETDLRYLCLTIRTDWKGSNRRLGGQNTYQGKIGLRRLGRITAAMSKTRLKSRCGH